MDNDKKEDNRSSGSNIWEHQWCRYQKSIKKAEKVYFTSQILVHEYWTILDHFCVRVLKASE